MKTLLFAWIALAMPFLQTPGTEKAPDFTAEYSAIVKEFEEARTTYYEPYSKAKSDEEREKIRLDPAKEPTKLFVPRFQDLAKRAKGTEAGARSLLWITGNVREQGSTTVEDAVDELLDGYLESALLEDFAEQFQYGPGTMGPARAREVLEKIAQDSPHAEVKAASLFSLGAILGAEESASKEEAAPLLRRLQKEHPSSAYAARAENLLFEIEHLQVGMTAPEFETVDEKGETFKLSDYRGKVVVLDFWGFW